MKKIIFICFNLIIFLLSLLFVFFIKSEKNEYSSILNLYLHLDIIDFIDKSILIAIIVSVICFLIFLISIKVSDKNKKLIVVIDVLLIILLLSFSIYSTVSISKKQAAEKIVKYDTISTNVSYIDLYSFINVRDNNQYNEQVILFEDNNIITDNYIVDQNYFEFQSSTRCVSFSEPKALFGYYTEIYSNFCNTDEVIKEFSETELSELNITKGFYEINSYTDCDMTMVFIKNSSVYRITITGINTFDDSIINEVKNL